jgi:hypothetical protein
MTITVTSAVEAEKLLIVRAARSAQRRRCANAIGRQVVWVETAGPAAEYRP